MTDPLKTLQNFIRYKRYRRARRFIERYEGYGATFHTNGEARLIERLPNKNDFRTIFDVGANVGHWTKTAVETFAHAEVHAFELSQGTFKTLELALSDHPRAKLNNFGLSNETAEIEFKDYGDDNEVNTMIGRVTFHDKKLSPKVSKTHVMSGDHYCKQNGIRSIDLLKIDVEGAESLVLQGFSEMFSSGSIGVIQFEYGYAAGDAHFLMKDFYEFFRDHGYVLGPLKPDGVIFMDFHYGLNNFKSGPNFVAVKDTLTTVQERIRTDGIRGYPSN